MNEVITKLRELRNKYEKLFDLAKTRNMEDYYLRLIDSIDDIIEDIKKESE